MHGLSNFVRHNFDKYIKISLTSTRAENKVCMCIVTNLLNYSWLRYRFFC